MHMERAGARRCLHVVREPRRQRAPQLAIAIMPREAAQWTAQFVGPPALAQAGEQHRQREFVVAVDRRLRAMAAPGVQRGARGLPGTHEAIVATEIPAEGKTGLAAALAAKAFVQGLQAAPQIGCRGGLGHQHGELAQRHRRSGQAGLVLGEQPAHALLRGEDGIGRQRRVGDLDQQGDARSGEIDAETARPVVQPGARRGHAD